jgi:hypothetical protein
MRKATLKMVNIIVVLDDFCFFERFMTTGLMVLNASRTPVKIFATITNMTGTMMKNAVSRFINIFITNVL